MIVEYIKGSILDAEQKYIAHGVNCQNKMGSGVAKVLYEKYPEVKKEYHEYCNNITRPKYLLGKSHFIDCGEKGVYNCFTQFYYGYDGKRYVNYAAIAQCFIHLSELGLEEIAIPKIGCGLAGGNWEIVSRIIDDATGNDLDVYVYEL